MNFQHCRANPGTFQQIQGTATKYNIQQGKFGPYALGDITDVLGESVGVLFGSSKPLEDGTVKSPLPGPECVQHLALWGALYDANKQQYRVMFNGYAHGNTPQPQAPPQEPYHVPVPAPQESFHQLPQSPPPSTQAPMTPPATIDPTRNSIEAQTALNRAVDLAVGRKDLVPDLVTLCDVQGHFKTLLQTGTVDPIAFAAPMPIGEQHPTDPNQDVSDLPKELQENYDPRQG